MQATVVTLIVVLAAAYAAWVLMPGALRRRVVGMVADLAPEKFRAKLERAGAQEPGCSSCKGCATDAKTASGGIKIIELRRR